MFGCADGSAGYKQATAARVLLQTAPAASSKSLAPHDVEAAPVANSSATAATAVILVMNLYGTNLIPFDLTQRAVLMSVFSNTTSNSANMTLLSVSEFLPNNTTPSPAPSRRHLLASRKSLGKPCSSGTQHTSIYMCLQGVDARTASAVELCQMHQAMCLAHTVSVQP